MVEGEGGGGDIKNLSTQNTKIADFKKCVNPPVNNNKTTLTYVIKSYNLKKFKQQIFNQLFIITSFTILIIKY